MTTQGDVEVKLTIAISRLDQLGIEGEWEAFQVVAPIIKGLITGEECKPDHLKRCIKALDNMRNALRYILYRTPQTHTGHMMDDSEQRKDSRWRPVV